MLHAFRLSNTRSGLDFDVALDPGRRVYCLIGENAVGKTALLESWAQVCWGLHALWRDPTPDLRFSGWRLDTRFSQILENKATFVMPKITIGSKEVHITPRQDWRDMNPLQGGFDHLLELEARLGVRIVDRPFIFISATERASISNLGAEALSLVGDKMVAFAQAISRSIAATQREPVDSTSVSTWLAARLLLNPDFVVGLRSPHHEVLELLRLMARFDPSHFSEAIRVMDGRERPNIAYQDGQVLWMGRPLDKLASGWTALLKIFQEIISSVSAWEAMRDSTDILGSDALIFIDEIDAHLHPRWQANLLPFLKESFPNATFVVTTHSPLIVRDTEPGEGYELVREGSRVSARRLGSPRDWYLSDVLADAFHVRLPAPGSEASEGGALQDLLLDYARTVREFTSSKGDSSRDGAIRLYDAILPRLPADDPRRRTVEQLRQLLG